MARLYPKNKWLIRQSPIRRIIFYTPGKLPPSTATKIGMSRPIHREHQYGPQGHKSPKMNIFRAGHKPFRGLPRRLKHRLKKEVFLSSLKYSCFIRQGPIRRVVFYSPRKTAAIGRYQNWYVPAHPSTAPVWPAGPQIPQNEYFPGRPQALPGPGPPSQAQAKERSISIVFKI